MLKASEKAYEGAQKSYDQGVITVISLILAERNLAQARYTEIDSKASLLQAAASLVYASGTGAQAGSESISASSVR
jgi:outer membrane protein TolC